MKKKFLLLFLSLIMCLSLTACKDKEENKTNNNNQNEEIEESGTSLSAEEITELGDIATKIGDYLANHDYDNVVTYYIDTDNGKIVVELQDNSKEKQDWFKKNIVSSDKIEFKESSN